MPSGFVQAAREALRATAGGAIFCGLKVVINESYRYNKTMDSEISTSPAVLPPGGSLGPVLDAAQKYVAMATSQNTLRAYRSDWADFSRWCEHERLRSYPATPAIVGLYVAALASKHKVSTITRRLAAISRYHRDRNRYNPASMKYSSVCEVIRGIKREKGVRVEPKAALSTDDLRRMVTALPQSPRGLRDCAMLLIGFAGGFRRSELAVLELTDVEDTVDGLKILIRRSKTDQEGEGRIIGVPYGSDPRSCPVRAYRKWILASALTEGPVFRHFHNKKMGTTGISAQTVALVVKRAAEHAGIDPTDLAGHSLRSGCATVAARNGASERSIMNQTGHRSVSTLRKYIRAGSLFHENAAAKLGL
jgi:site-specific recombinase XerD